MGQSHAGHGPETRQEKARALPCMGLSHARETLQAWARTMPRATPGLGQNRARHGPEPRQAWTRATLGKGQSYTRHRPEPRQVWARDTPGMGQNHATRHGPEPRQAWPTTTPLQVVSFVCHPCFCVQLCVKSGRSVKVGLCPWIIFLDLPKFGF